MPAGGHGGPGAIQPQSIKLALEASDQMLAAKERDANKVRCVSSFSMIRHCLVIMWVFAMPS